MVGLGILNLGLVLKKFELLWRLKGDEVVVGVGWLVGFIRGVCEVKEFVLIMDAAVEVAEVMVVVVRGSGWLWVFL